MLPLAEIDCDTDGAVTAQDLLATECLNPWSVTSPLFDGAVTAQTDGIMARQGRIVMLGQRPPKRWSMAQPMGTLVRQLVHEIGVSAEISRRAEWARVVGWY